MYHLKENETVVSSKSKGLKFTGSNRSLRREVLNRNILKIKQNVSQSTVGPKSAEEFINWKDPSPSSLHAGVSRGNLDNISTLVVNKWPMPATSSQTSYGAQSSDITMPSTSIAKEPIIKNIQINGRRVPLKVLNIIAAAEFNSNNSSERLTSSSLSSLQRNISDKPILERRHHYSSSADDEQEIMDRNGISNSGLWLGLKTAHAQLDLAKIMFFYGDSFDNHQIYELDQATDILKHPRFDITRMTTLYVHGYIETPEVESIHVIVDAYQSNGEQNILILDWGDLADGNYLLDAVQNAKQLGPKMANVLMELFNNGMQRDLFHLVGHSLGGQLSGMIGRSILKKSKGTIKLKRISALDPAFPPFYPAIGTTAISKNDAILVDVIHTDAGLYGAPRSTGTVDFWPNSGKTLQPGCPKRNYKLLSDNGLKDLCSHRRSWRFWAESVAAKEKPTFHSAKSKNWSDFKKGRIDESYIIPMGLNCPESVRPGDYYLQTNGDQPYSKGVNGITYEKNENVVTNTDS